MLFLFYRHTDVRRFSKTRPKITRTLPNIFRNFRRVWKITEDCRRLSRKLRRCFDDTQTNLRTIYKRDKLDISEIIDIFTSEDMQNTPLESRMWFRMVLRVVYFPVNHSCLYNKNVYCFYFSAWLSLSNFQWYGFTPEAAAIYPLRKREKKEKYWLDNVFYVFFSFLFSFFFLLF